MLCGEPVPYHIRKKARNMDERADRKTFVVHESEKSDAGSDARSENSHALVTLRQQPVRRATCVQHRLPDRGQSASDIRGDEVLGSLQFRRFSMMVVRQAQAK